MSEVMPPEIAKAIVAVKKRIRQLAYDAKNEFQGWRYVSVDAFYAAIGPLMAEAGLCSIVDEAEPGIVETRETTNDRGVTKSGKWLTSHYSIHLVHESGASYGPIRRTMTVLASGPQSFGASVSYADKYFLRALFKVPTGEMGEVDSHEQNGLPESKSEPDWWVATKQSGNAQLRQAKSLDDLRRLWDMLTYDEKAACKEEKNKLKAALQLAAAETPAPAESESPITRWVQLLGIAGQDLRAVNALIRDDFVPLKLDVGTRNEIWTLIQNQGHANGWRWNRESMAFSPKEEV